jgi:toxin-antitoxin system PIN domain toxin
MTSSVFPDLNVWLALSVENHEHHEAAEAWRFESRTERLVFCRHTQLGLFRLLSTAAIMGPKTLSQTACWKMYDNLLKSGIAGFEDEPPGLEDWLRIMTGGAEHSPKVWADAYLCAFAEAARLTLITFDRSLHRKAKGSMLLR